MGWAILPVFYQYMGMSHFPSHLGFCWCSQICLRVHVKGSELSVLLSAPATWGYHIFNKMQTLTELHQKPFYSSPGM